ncbi:MAG: MBL fold metallo-hydrolase [Firmicutes bacterium]|nr:MBL fold metallo-hydrolase [Bacillota bacterium]MCM1401716.1 MBL fold metallo-hydrolase [Bacteroides sp.]MCM1477745.1 MBL fold metallo-hydrolase [Bacteroides sp.]
MKIKRFEFNMFGVNTYVVWDENTGQAAIVDPGMMTAADNRELDKFIQEKNLTVKYLLNTHLHIDHTLGNNRVEQRYGVETWANSNDDFLGSQRQAQARMFGINAGELPALKIASDLADGSELMLGKEKLEVIAVPGHSPGSVAFYSPEGKFVITGDALFRQSIGRTDLPGGNQRQLIESVTSRLLTLPAETTVYPGHGPETTVGYERKYNPFL